MENFINSYLSCGEIPAEFRTAELASACTEIAVQLLENNAKFNLTAITDPAEILHKHILDSLLAAEILSGKLPEGIPQPRLIDVGSGAGFPSLPIAAALPKMRVTALDATAKKCAHMRSAAARAHLANFSAVNGRAEDLGRMPAQREKYDFVTARAVANLPVLAELCLPLCRVGGIFLAMKGKSARDEISAASAGIDKLGGRVVDCKEYRVPGDENPRYMVLIQKVRPTPAAYPRQYGTISKNPL